MICGEALADPVLGHVIQGAGGLVEQEDVGPRGDRPGDHESLPLPARESALPVANDREHAHGHLGDFLVNPAQPGGFPGIVEGKRRGADDVRKDVAGGQLSVLEHDPDLAPDGL